MTSSTAPPAVDLAKIGKGKVFHHVKMIERGATSNAPDSVATICGISGDATEHAEGVDARAETVAGSKVCTDCRSLTTRRIEKERAQELTDEANARVGEWPADLLDIPEDTTNAGDDAGTAPAEPATEEDSMSVATPEKTKTSRKRATSKRATAKRSTAARSPKRAASKRQPAAPVGTTTGTVSARSAAIAIAKRVGSEITVKELVAKTLATKGVSLPGKTPAATVGAQIYTECKRENGQLEKTGKGTVKYRAPK